MSNPSHVWGSNEVQFARLLCEIVAAEELLNWPEIRDSMSLDDEDLHELFDRAHIVWEKAMKEEGGSMSDSRDIEKVNDWLDFVEEEEK